MQAGLLSPKATTEFLDHGCHTDKAPEDLQIAPGSRQQEECVLRNEGCGQSRLGAQDRSVPISVPELACASESSCVLKSLANTIMVPEKRYLEGNNKQQKTSFGYFFSHRVLTRLFTIAALVIEPRGICFRGEKP
jgi:hypothetical protein